MAWQRNRYYIRNTRVAGRVVTEYIGCGEDADLIAARDQVASQDRADARKAARAEHDKNRVPSELRDYSAAVRAAVGAALTSLGFRQHKRQWRMRRMTEMVPDLSADARRARDLLGKKKASAAECAEFRRLLDANLALPKIFGDLARVTRASMMGTLNDAPMLRIAVERRCTQLATDLGYHEASTLEHLLIDEVVLCWFDLYRIESTYASNTRDEFKFDDMEHWERILTSKQSRYLRAIESLARVRRLLKLPAVQLNIAEQQVNIHNGTERP